MTVLYITAHGHRVTYQRGIEHTLHRGIEVIHVTVQDRALHLHPLPKPL